MLKSKALTYFFLSFFFFATTIFVNHGFCRDVVYYAVGDNGKEKSRTGSVGHTQQFDQKLKLYDVHTNVYCRKCTSFFFFSFTLFLSLCFSNLLRIKFMFIYGQNGDEKFNLRQCIVSIFINKFYFFVYAFTDQKCLCFLKSFI